MNLFFFIMCLFSDRSQHSCFRMLSVKVCCIQMLMVNTLYVFFFSCWFKFKCSVHESVLKGILKLGRMQYYKTVAAVFCGTSVCALPTGFLILLTLFCGFKSARSWTSLPTRWFLTSKIKCIHGQRNQDGFGYSVRGME